MTGKKKLPFGTVIVILVAALILVCILSTTLGRYPISIRELGGITWDQLMKLVEQLGDRLGLDVSGLRPEPFWTATQEALFLKYRIPRIAIACMVGCSLSTAGACYQGVFQNPMAAPDILGASSGAALGASLAIILGYMNAVIGGMAFVFSLATVALVILVGNRARGNRVVGLILSGVMISSLVSSCTSFIKLIADTEDQLPAITYWLMGSFNGAKSEDILFAAIPMAIGLIPIFILRWRINILSLGDDEAQTLGINAKRLRIIIIICSALITAASVAVSGIIGWVGLVIPHMVRRVVGNDYKKLIPATMLFGAIFMLLVDNICRNVWATDLPIGILTSFVGAPFFVYLILKEGDRL